MLYQTVKPAEFMDKLACKGRKMFEDKNKVSAAVKSTKCCKENVYKNESIGIKWLKVS